jgi:hypothetical protein
MKLGYKTKIRELYTIPFVIYTINYTETITGLSRYISHSKVPPTIQECYASLD